MDYVTNTYENTKLHPSLKIVYPKLDYNLSVLEDFISCYNGHLFDTTLYYNFILLFDTKLSVVSYHINKNLMLSKIKICQGLNFQEENMGRTSVSETFRTQQTTVMIPQKSKNPILGNMTNCTVPICLDNETIGYIAAFFLSSKYDELSIKTFKLFAELIVNSFKLLRTRTDVKDYVLDAIMPGFDPHVLSKAEKEVLNYMKKGYSNKDISNHLYLSENTIGFHSKLIKEKLSCSNRTEAAVNTILYEMLELICKYN